MSRPGDFPTRFLISLVGSLALTLAFALSPRIETAEAQRTVPINYFSILRYSPAPGPGNYFQIDGAGVYGQLEGSAGLQIEYAHLPFVIYNSNCVDAEGNDCTVDGTEAELVQYTAVAHVMGTIALFDRLQIGLVLPVALSSGQSYALGPGDFIPGGEQFAIGDPRLHLKGNIYSADGISLGAAAYVTAPLGLAMAGQSFLGDSLPSFGGHLIFEMINNGFHLAINVGGAWREQQQLFSTVVGPQLTYGGAIGYDITPMLGLYVEGVGASTFTEEADEHYVEARLGGNLRFSDFTVNLAAGAGLTAGVGSPMFRVLAGFAWAPMAADSDHDGVPDESDNCPSEPEDRDGFADEDGCPETDGDGDGLDDEEDRCPSEPEDQDGFEDSDGCPDTDNDGDGIQDGYDGCPDEPEDMDNDRDEDGCPDNDTDRDGVNDADDQCPNEPEDLDGFGDEDGCPETDFDEDGIPDDSDQCPDQAEDRNGTADEDGCPEGDGAAAAEGGGAAAAEGGEAAAAEGGEAASEGGSRRGRRRRRRRNR